MQIEVEEHPVQEIEAHGRCTSGLQNSLSDGADLSSQSAENRHLSIREAVVVFYSMDQVLEPS
ncbi:hypothetical protein KY285_023560 [Solanum tuberosum]|nr:hypothetical protein KY289_026075 [Solanum tuberosum]KAH0675759.1 hypothetical protein KY285_023560 [Solanum tuberosum]